MWLKIVFLVVVTNICSSVVFFSLLSRIDSLTVREVNLRDDAGNIVARLATKGGESKLTFYADDSKPAVEVGVDRRDRFTFLRFVAPDGNPLVSLNAMRNGDSSLTLLDRRWGTRVVLGAMPSETASDKPTDDWGIFIKKPGARTGIQLGVIESIPGGPSIYRILGN
jgi:hypothetical protein